MTAPLRLLLIEDHPGDARLIAELLRQVPDPAMTPALKTADTLARGLEVLREGGIDVVLLDLGLPESSGLETVERVAAHGRPTLIVLSGLHDEDLAIQALTAGAQDYLVKDQLDARMLYRAIRYAIGRRQAEDALTRELERTHELATERERRLQVEGESQWLRRLLQEREEMLQLLAHEVRQPLNNASAALETATAALAASTPGTLPHVRDPLERARHVLDHVIGTLNNALAAATLLLANSVGTITETDLDTLVGLVLGDIGDEERGRIVVESHSSIRTVQLQPTMMRLALANLLVNALAYSPPGSPVLLRVSDSEEPPALGFEVCDEGPGIPASLLPTVFDKGTRGAEARAGTGAGLGLYIVRRVVELHGGTIEMAPRLPRGTIARVTIPQGLAG